jgi:CheY-like chemotaxis protein
MPSAKKGKILIIEDNEDILDILQTVLSAEGYEVVTSEEGRILKNVLQINPDLIFLDNSLADGLGSKLCREIKSNPSTQHFRIILISANNQLEQLATDSLADGFLSKPFDLVELTKIAARELSPKA